MADRSGFSRNIHFVLEALVMAFVGLAVGITIAAVVSFSLYFAVLEMPPPLGAWARTNISAESAVFRLQTHLDFVK